MANIFKTSYLKFSQGKVLETDLTAVQNCVLKMFVLFCFYCSLKDTLNLS